MATRMPPDMAPTGQQQNHCMLPNNVAQANTHLSPQQQQQAQVNRTHMTLGSLGSSLGAHHSFNLVIRKRHVPEILGICNRGTQTHLLVICNDTLHHHPYPQRCS